MIVMFYIYKYFSWERYVDFTVIKMLFLKCERRQLASLPLQDWLSCIHVIHVRPKMIEAQEAKL